MKGGKIKASSGAVEMGFERNTVLLPIVSLKLLRTVSEGIRKSRKYAQIRSSIQEIGIIEPPVVAKQAKGGFLLLDGHIRVEILKALGKTDVLCLVSTDDEGFTYNRRINRLAIIQEHKMILKAIERGVPEARVASALNIDVSTLRHKIRLLDGVCPEAADMLKDKHVAGHAFWSIRRMTALRQIEAAELMIAMNKYSGTYARALLAATPQDQLVVSRKRKAIRGLTDEQMSLMERESASLEREFKIAEQNYGTDHLDLVLAKGYLTKLLRNARVVRHLAQHHQEFLVEFQKITDVEGDLSP
ncbi:MAG: ParB N-terminal domain-containing protein [Alphaproteobacteria bacterium]|nr:ParB N-terminal domain-containing protein [Alphaproteobacteria bacterium]